MNHKRLSGKSLGLIVVVALVAATGTVILSRSHAATPFVAQEAEAGTIKAPAVKASDTTASGSSAIRFMAATTTPTPTPTPPGSFQANCINKPSACGYPDATNTGVPAGVTLTNSGSVTASTNGQVIQNLLITNGQIVIKANNVTIKNVKISGCTYYPIDYGDNTGLIVEDTEIDSTCVDTTAGLSFGNFTALRMNIHGSADGIKANVNSVIQDSYIHDLKVTATTHNDGVQSTGGSNVTLKHNTCDIRGGGDTCIQFGSSDTGWKVSDNLFAGGPSTIWVLNGSSSTKNNSFTNNRFTRKFSGGPASIPGSGNTWTGNYYDDNGAVANQ